MFPQNESNVFALNTGGTNTEIPMWSQFIKWVFVINAKRVFTDVVPQVVIQMNHILSWRIVHCLFNLLISDHNVLRLK